MLFPITIFFFKILYEPINTWLSMVPCWTPGPMLNQVLRTNWSDRWKVWASPNMSAYCILSISQSGRMHLCNRYGLFISRWWIHSCITLPLAPCAIMRALLMWYTIIHCDDLLKPPWTDIIIIRPKNNNFKSWLTSIATTTVLNYINIRNPHLSSLPCPAPWIAGYRYTDTIELNLWT